MGLKILFLVFHGFSAHNGISKKIFGQVKGLQDCGADVQLCYYEVLDNGHRVWKVNEKLLVDFGTGHWAKLKKRFDFSALIAYVQKESINLVYMRSYHNASPFITAAVKKIRKAGAQVVMEIPTYPYDQEYIRRIDKIMQLPDRLFRNSLAAHLDGIVTFSQSEEIFGKKTIRISNGVDFDALPIRIPKPRIAKEIHLLGVAEIHYWHGFDRVIRGLGNYYKENHETKVYFHIVGNFSGKVEEHAIVSAIDTFKLKEFVVMHGALWGKDLDDIFDLADFAIGSLARHRSGITFIRTLKTREYAARGIPFIYSEIDSDFEDKPYVLKALPDESPINIKQIVDYCSVSLLSPQDIRADISDLSWSCQMKRVLDTLNLNL